MFLRWYVVYILSVLLVVLASVVHWQRLRMSDDGHAIMALQKQLEVVRGFVDEARLKASAAEQSAETWARNLAEVVRGREASLKNVDDLKKVIAIQTRLKASAAEREAAARADLEGERGARETAERALKIAREERDTAVLAARRARTDLTAVRAEATRTIAEAVAGAPQNSVPRESDGRSGSFADVAAEPTASLAGKDAAAADFTVTGAATIGASATTNKAYAMIKESTSALALDIALPENGSASTKAAASADGLASNATVFATDLPLPVRKPSLTQIETEASATTTQAPAASAAGGSVRPATSGETPSKPEKRKKSRRSADTKTSIDYFFSF